MKNAQRIQMVIMLLLDKTGLKSMLLKISRCWRRKEREEEIEIEGDF